MFKDIVNKSYKMLREKLAGKVELQELLNRNNVKMLKTSEYLSDVNEANDQSDFAVKPWGPPGKVMVWSYRFQFDNYARKRLFLQAVESYPKQRWDGWIRWMDDISNYQGEITVEAHCKVPVDETNRFRYEFEEFITKKIVIRECA